MNNNGNECWFCGSKIHTRQWYCNGKPVLMCGEHSATTRAGLRLRAVGELPTAEYLDAMIGINTDPGIDTWEEIKA